MKSYSVGHVRQFFYLTNVAMASHVIVSIHSYKFNTEPLDEVEMQVCEHENKS
jgi:hypothetical protein